MSSATVTPRLIYAEDIAVATAPGQQDVVNVLGLGPTLLTRVNFAQLAVAVPTYANDAAAQAANLLPGRLYVTPAGVYRVKASWSVVPSGTVNGVNAIFTVATPFESIDLFRDGMKMFAGTDFNVTFDPVLGVTITFTSNNIPSIGAILEVKGNA